VLTVVNNNYDAPVYSYTMPAYGQYQGMGAAYKNIGLNFVINSVRKTPYRDNLYRFTSGVPVSNLCPGDEVMLYASGGALSSPLAKVVYIGEENNEPILYSEVPLNRTEYQGMIIRSGYRNQLSVSAEGISALADPSVKGNTRSYSKKITIPKIN